MKRTSMITGRLTVMLMLIAALATLFGCTRQRPSDKPPIHLNPNMDTQEKYKAQASSGFFEDGATMRQPVEGTVARGELRDDDAYYRGRNADSSFVATSPVPTTMQLLERGHPGNAIDELG